MAINYRKHRRTIEQMYMDKATISGYFDVLKPDGAKRKQLQVIYSDQTCHLSQTGLPKNGQTAAQNDVRYDAKLFIAPELEIKQGYTIAVTRAATGRLTTYTVGEPFPPYQSHQEINLSFKGEA